MRQQVDLQRTVAPGLDVRVVRDEAGFAALEEAWSELLDQSAASIFSSWQWLHPWQQRPGGSRQPFLICARDRMTRRLHGLLPLYLEVQHGAGRRYRRLGLLGDEGVGSDHLGPLVRQGEEEKALAALTQGLLSHQEEWDLLELLDVDTDSPSTRALVEQLRSAGLGVRFEERNECPFEPFEPGLTFERFLARTRRADNFLRRRRWLERQPGFRIERAESSEEVQQALSSFFRLHELRWQGHSQLNTPEAQAFHREAAARLAQRGQLRLYTLWVEGAAVASVHALRHGGTFSYYNAGYDPAWQSKSVGLVLVGTTFQDAIAEGHREYDFLRGTEPYKLEWTTQVRRTARIQIWRPGGPGAWVAHAERLGQQTRRVLRSVLPARALSALRRIRSSALRSDTRPHD
ncbi:MAG: GNAT family N-acetyltransferase [Hyalangium sp.]|uniref:GNAT family N-acetyltransferase n=1 Tax=Hyalangium sp. TaxID=2028555 RepID=UPI003899D371